jgi:hypothetical protein
MIEILRETTSRMPSVNWHIASQGINFGSNDILQGRRLTSVLMRWRSLQLFLQSSADSFCIWFCVYTRQVLQLAGMQL